MPSVKVLTLRKNPDAKADPWLALDQMIDKYAHTDADGRVTMQIRSGPHIVKMEVVTDRSMTNHILSVRMYTLPDPKSTLRDPHNSYEYALYITWDRSEHPDGDAYINIISAKPSHNVPTGTDAIKLAVALCQHVNSPGASLYDASSKACGEDGEVSIRPTRMLSQGEGWYESKGFHSVLENIEPKVFQRHVQGLRSIKVSKMLDAVNSWDSLIRSALISHELDEGRVKGVVHDRNSKPAERALTLSEGITLLQDLSTIHESLKSVPGKSTLGEVIDELNRSDCKQAGKLVTALLPEGEQGVFVELRGKSVKPWPSMTSWIYTWRVLQARPTLYIRFRDAGTS
jgi:hypothetical protein